MSSPQKKSVLRCDEDLEWSRDLIASLREATRQVPGAPRKTRKTNIPVEERLRVNMKRMRVVKKKLF